MSDISKTLKRAFIDSQMEYIVDSVHSFSPVFENRMKRLIKSQKGFMKLINTAGKRVACILLSVLIIVAASVSSVEALRKPFTEAVKSFFVSVKELLYGTNAANIAEYFTDDITEIKTVNYITTVPKEYIIKEEEKIKQFTELLSNTVWEVPRTEWDAFADDIFWSFEFKNGKKIVCTVNLCGFGEQYGIVQIIGNKKSEVFNISVQTYLDIQAFTTRKYYLHKSDFELPGKKFCLEQQKNMLSGLNDKEKKCVGEELRDVHYLIEDLLIENVSLLKEPDSRYWDAAITGEKFTDPFSGETYENGYGCFNSALHHVENIINIIKDCETKRRFESIYKDLKSACDNHDIGSIFTVHEYIHDYDYFAVNYPVYYEMQPIDWGGIDNYFGHLS